jgi:circadian clock protein KaiC
MERQAEESIGTIQKMPTGITGFDELSGGGLPRGRTTLITGGPGSGKTVFALNTLVNGARTYREPGIFIAFEENSRQITVNSASFGWDLQDLIDRKLIFIDARLSADAIQSGAFDVSGMLAGVKAKADEMSRAAGGAPVRVVFDSIDVLLSRLQNPFAQKEEVYRVHDWLARERLSGIVTAKATGQEDEFSFMQFMADCVIELRRIVDEGVSHRTLTIVKYRGSSFAENAFNVIIGPHGFEVPSPSAFDLNYPVSRERVSTGISQLNQMMDGGYLRGSSILVTGAPGTAKSTLAGSFIDATCQHGERAIYISFDEGPQEIIRNLSSVGILLEPHVDSGLLLMHSNRAEAQSAIEHLVEIKRLMKEHQPRALVIDPLSAMGKAGGDQLAKNMSQRLIYETKAEGVTLLMTSLLGSLDPEMEATPIEISTIADTWIHLSYMVKAGERNRALTIVKSRGTAHSNQVRELILSDEGAELTQVYTAGGEVLMGTMRFEKEASEAETKRRLEEETEQKVQELKRKQAESQVRMQTLKQEIEVQGHELARLEREAERRSHQQVENAEEVRRRREGGEDEA